MKWFLSLLCIAVSLSSVFGQKLPSKKMAEELLRPQQIVQKALPARLAVPPAIRGAARTAGYAVQSVKKEGNATSSEGRPVLSPEASAYLERLAARRAADAKSAPALTPLQEVEKNIRQSLVEIVGRATGELMGSGFVVRSGSGTLYAVASYHVVGHAGNALAVRIYDAEGNPVFYPCVLVSASGSYGINAPDTAIIELPARAARHVKPLKVAYGLPAPNTTLAAWGIPYVQGHAIRVGDLRVQHAEGFKIVMHSRQEASHLRGLCGSPVLNEEGKVVGIFNGHKEGQELFFAVNARKALDWLISNYESGRQATLAFKLHGRTVFTLPAGETIGKVRHLDELGRPLAEVYVPRYDGAFDLEHLEGLFPDIKPADRLDFEIVKHRFVDRIISVEIL